ncbi:MAG: hypothetical protein F2675_02920 [Actinobacteria bacterium]|uniref:Unannotated protein n=1 Tax=freshwater metagenome TaxID=449393 RepID=A0A6J6MKC6_9ZZZZ|nr:hypothetical protein [Actinomycetota bacterium]MSY41305.1 hypothetical protein [Actinomycetota bacterium]
MKRNALAALSGITLALAIGLTAIGSATTAYAAESPGTVVAAAETAAKPSILASSPRGLTVTGVHGSSVTIVTRSGPGSTTPITKSPDKSGRVTFSNLIAGANYVVVHDGKIIGSGTPVNAVGSATDLVVRTTSKNNTVKLDWSHKATKTNGGAGVTYVITAKPAGGSGKTVTAEMTGTTTRSSSAAKSSMLSGLDPDALYVFTITPKNSAGTGKSSVARMERSLADITGIKSTGATEPVVVVIEVEPAEKPVAVKPTEAKPATPAPAPAPAPGPASPSTRTIYVCPDAYTETGSGVCEKTSAYTYTSIGYTYHSEPNYVQVQIGTTERSHPFDGNACGWGTLYGNTCYEYTAVYETRQQGTNQVKDATPAGYTDTGSTWSKKDAMPAGYTDNGSAWVQTAAKVAKVVPA